MANHYFGADLGAQSPDDVATGTSTTSKNVELVVLDGVTGLTGEKQRLLKLIELIEQKVAASDAPV